MLAPLQLTDYAIDGLAYEQVRRKAGDAGVAASQASLGFRFAENEEDGRFHLGLEVNINQDGLPEESAGEVLHRGQIRISGWFAWAEGVDPTELENARKLLLVNGYSVLYGIARTHFVHLTEPGPAPRLMLPSITFLPIIEQWLAEEEGDSGAAEGE
jgi:preprotein translocase subunit SecB